MCSQANGIPDDEETWDVFNVKTTGCWVIKTQKKENNFIIKLTQEEKDEMEKLAAGYDERWLALMLLKELKIIAGMIEKRKEENEFWEGEIDKRKTNIKKLDKRDSVDLDDDLDDDDLDDDVDDFDY